MVRRVPRKTSPDRWEARGTDPRTKKQVALGVYDTKEQAQQAELDFKADVKLNRRGEETCDSFANRWMRDYGAGRRGPSTVKHNNQMIAAFARDFAGRSLRDIKRAEARLWVHGGYAGPHVREIAAKWSGARVEGSEVIVPKHLGNGKVVRAMFSDAINEGLAVENPFSNIRVSTPTRKEIHPLTAEEVDRLVVCAEGVWGQYGAEMYGPLIAVAAYSGMRPGELYALEWRDLDFHRRRIHIRGQYNSRIGRVTRPKNTEERVIALFPPAAEALKQIPPDKYQALGRDAKARRDLDFSDDIIFRVREGTPFTQRTTNYYWHDTVERFLGGLESRRLNELTTKYDQETGSYLPKPLVFYELRHFCASQMARRNANPREIARQLGQRDGGKLAQELYTHDYQEESLDDMLTKFDSYEEPKRRRKAS